MTTPLWQRMTAAGAPPHVVADQITAVWDWLHEALGDYVPNVVYNSLSQQAIEAAEVMDAGGAESVEEAKAPEARPAGPTADQQAAIDGILDGDSEPGEAEAIPIKLLRQPVGPWKISGEERILPIRTNIASGCEVVQEDEFDDDAEVRAWTIEAYHWDCPACNSLLMAINRDDCYSTSDTDPVKCPVCGDYSAYIHGSHGVSVSVLIHGATRITDAEADRIMGIDDR